MTRCASCGSYVVRPPASECERCARLRLVGGIVEALTIPWPRPVVPAVPALLDALDAIAELCLIEPARRRRAHNRELMDEQREAQRGAREAYDDGRADGREAER